MSGLIGQVGARSGVVGSTTDSTQLDYEEGTWTPIFDGTGGAPTQSYAHQVGRYIKIGNVVYATFSCKLATSGISTGGGTGIVGGLPFNAVSVTNLVPGGGSVVQSSSCNLHPPDNLEGRAGLNNMVMRYNNGSSGTTGVGGTVYQNSTSMDGFIIYPTS
jgi:hypothetical protein